MKFAIGGATTLIFILGLIGNAASAHAQQNSEMKSVKITAPSEIKYVPIPFAPGAEYTFLASDVAKSENYELRVHLKPDAKIPPHTHPDTRMPTILSGELAIGTGAKFDPENTTSIPTGGFFVMPAGVIHWAWAKSGEVTYQEAGTGPTGTTLVK